MTSSYLISFGFVLALSLVGLARQSSCHTKSDNSSPPPETRQNTNEQTGTFVPSGVWGGDHIQIEAGDHGVLIEYDCAHGEITERLRIDSAGRFHAKGTHVREHGGPVRNDETPVNHPADYSGNVNGNQMSLTITLSDSSESIGTFKLVRGNEGNLVKCR